MNQKHSDISDNEIRVISSSPADGGRDSNTTTRRHLKRRVAIVVFAAVVTVAGIVASLMIATGSGHETEVRLVREATVPAEPKVEEPAEAPKGYTALRDTVAGGVELSILTPRDATAVLEIGTGALSDTTVVLAMQAADVRGDNGEIVGACVINGELRSKGESKAGFCSIVNGKITVGVADATPMLEEALMTDGYFFRQYPLVVGGQVVENKPKGRAIRKALAEVDGSVSVITSRRRLTFHDFSQALTDMGVRNAIYLVGGEASGVYTDADGNRFMIGNNPGDKWANVNYIVWR
ncbi:MAG: phosphodiester glycosidase family protein [Muribaculaceae bacterium]|nr:phosphodiester glycosidase family protein [Muribaculaceae bacterium]